MRSTIKGLQEEIKKRDELLESEKESFNKLWRGLCDALGVKSYQTEVPEAIAKVKSLLEAQRLHEARVPIQVEMLREELARAWHMVRSISGDKLLGQLPPSREDVLRVRGYDDFINDRKPAPVTPMTFDPFAHPDRGPRF